MPHGQVARPPGPQPQSPLLVLARAPGTGLCSGGPEMEPRGPPAEPLMCPFPLKPHPAEPQHPETSGGLHVAAGSVTW